MTVLADQRLPVFMRVGTGGEEYQVGEIAIPVVGTGEGTVTMQRSRPARVLRAVADEIDLPSGGLGPEGPGG